MQSFLAFEWPRRQPLVLALALCAGAAWYNSAWIEPPLIGIASTFAMLLAVYGLMRRIALVPRIFGLVVLILLGFSAGTLSGKLAVMRTAVPTIAAPTGPVMLEGWVEDVESAKRGVRLRLLVHAIDGLPASQTPDHVRLTHTNSLEVESGRFVRCWSVLRPPPAPVIEGDYAFHRQAFFERLGGVGYVQGRCRGGTLGKPAGLADQARLKVAEWRRQLAHYVYQAAGERAGGFAAAVASGDRSFIDSADQDALRGSGLAHLLAISGLHMGIVGGLVYLMVWRGLALIEPLALRIAVQKPAALAALCASGAYLVLSGASISTQRAFIMALVLFGAILFDRAALSLRSLAIAMIAVVILAPWSVLTPGFQMSFAATGALIATYEAWQRRRRQDGQMGRRSPAFWAKSLFMTSLVSSLATAPFAIYHFERFAGLGLIANLFAMPMISLVSAPLAGASLVLSPFGLSGVPLRLFGYSLEWVLWVGHVFSNLAPDEVSQSIPMPAGALAFFSLAMVLAMMCQGWQWRAALFLVFSLAGALLWAMTPHAGIHWAPNGAVYLVDQTGHVDIVQLVDGDGLAPLRYADRPVLDDCRSTVCRRQVGTAQIVLMGAEQAQRCPEASLGQGALSCADADLWAEVREAGGLSWRLDGGVLARADRMPCGVRPWAPCLSRSLTRSDE